MKTKIKLTAIFLCILMLSLMLYACGEKPAEPTNDESGDYIADDKKLLPNDDFQEPKEVYNDVKEPEIEEEVYMVARKENDEYRYAIYSDDTVRIERYLVLVTDGFIGVKVGIEDFIISDSIDGYKVSSIGDGAFEGWNDLKSIKIPDSVTYIGRGAFHGCFSLTSVNIPNGVTSIGEYAFQGCRSLTSVNIPDGVTSIGDNAFQYCISLTSVNIPNSVTSIGKYAFQYCDDLTSVNIPNSVTSIGEYAFQGCRNLTSVNIPDSVTSIGQDNRGILGTYVFDGCDNLTIICSKDSAAHKYCTENNINFELK